MIRVTQLWVYPIKSLGGVALTEAIVGERGFRYDRRFMLVTPDGQAMTQHRYPQMALLEVALVDNQYCRVWPRHQPDKGLLFPIEPPATPHEPVVPVTIWASTNVAAVEVCSQANHWFSRQLGMDCRLVFMPDTTHRAVDPDYARHNESVSFADGFLYLLIGEPSLHDLNQRLDQPVEMLRFRPNIVVSNCGPYEEETWARFTIGGLPFYRGEPCGRCVLITLDPATGQKGPEPLRTLATYRQREHRTVFGQYVLAESGQQNLAKTPGYKTSAGRPGVIRVGHPLDVITGDPPGLPVAEATIPYPPATRPLPAK